MSTRLPAYTPPGPPIEGAYYERYARWSAEVGSERLRDAMVNAYRRQSIREGCTLEQAMLRSLYGAERAGLLS